MSSKAKALTKGSALGMIDFFANAIVGLVITPFIIHSLGDRMYGLWMIVGSFLGFYGMFDFGLVSAVQRYISKAVGNKDHEEINKVVNTSMFLFLIIGLVVLLITIIIVLFAAIFLKNISEINLFRQIIMTLGISVAVGFPMRVFSAILISNIRYDIYTSVELSKLFIRTVLVVVSLRAGYGILSLALITFGVEAIGYIVKFILVKTMFNYIILSKMLIDRTKIKSLFKYSVVTFTIQISDRLRSGVDNFVIAAFLGLSFITPYSIAFNLKQYLGKFITSAIGLTMPIFSQYEAKGDYKSIREKFMFITKLSSYLSIFIGGTLIIFGQPFIERWVGKEYLSSYPVLVVLLIPSIIASMQSPSVQLLYGISKHNFYAVSNTIEGVANFILSIILVKKLGIIGVAIGTAIPMIVVKLFIQPVYTCRLIKLSVYKYYFELIMPIILKSCGILLTFWFVFKSFIMPNYLHLLIFATCEFILFTTIVYLTGLNNIERGYFRKAIFVRGS